MALKTICTLMMETINVMERNYERALPYRKVEIGGKLGRKDERTAKAEKSGPYLLRDGITIRIEETVRSADTSM